MFGGKERKKKQKDKDYRIMVGRIVQAVQSSVGEEVQLHDMPLESGGPSSRALVLKTETNAAVVLLSQADNGLWGATMRNEDWTAQIIPTKHLEHMIIPVMLGSFGERPRAIRMFARLLQSVPGHMSVEHLPHTERVWPLLKSLSFSKTYVGQNKGRLEVSVGIDRSDPEAPKYKLTGSDNFRGDVIVSDWFDDPVKIVKTADQFNLMAFEQDPTKTVL